MKLLGTNKDNSVVWLYAPAADLNDATRYYVSTLRLGLANVGRTLVHVPTADSIPWRADVLVLDCKRALVVALRRPRCKFWLWLQGIVPEEAELQFGSGVRKTYWTAFERLTIPRARGVFMVSTAMKQHYEQKYGFSHLPSFVMPCVNYNIELAAFETDGKYTHPSFVYAGSLQRWQCFEQSLRSFELVQQQIPAATFTVLTRDCETAHKLIRQHCLVNVSVDYIPPDRLQNALAAFKYGFVLRDHHPVNNVATPTKVSSYMAAGVIPIMTTAVQDYAVRLESVDPLVMLDGTEPLGVAEMILKMEHRTLEPRFVYEQYSGVFSSYFDHALYGREIEAFFCRTGLDAPYAGSSPHDRRSELRYQTDTE